VSRTSKVFALAILVLGFMPWCAAPSFAVAEEEAGAASSAVLPAALNEMTQTIADAVAGVAVDGWDPTAIERYVVANLYDKINGRSELYMSYGVKSMVFSSFVHAADHSQYLDVFLYDMGSVPGAFGVYSVERWGDWEALELGRDGYRTDTDVFFWKGPYYATVLGSGEEPAVREAQQKLARALAGRLNDSDEALWGFEILPAESLIPESVQYFMVDALSLGFLNNTYTAEYRYGDREVRHFISKQGSGSGAKETFDRFVSFMKKYGKRVESVSAGPDSLKVADMGGGYYDAVFHVGEYVAGVTSAPDRALAIEAAGRFREDLGAAAGASE